MSEERAVPVAYEPPKVTFHGGFTSLTQGLTGTTSDALCASTQGQVPSNIACVKITS
jgi:hypothetical protein